MRLIKLEASDPRFKTVNFNPTGISFILAKQANPDNTDVSKTYNGVGKSLLIALVHFCLGASQKPSFKEKLPDWTFYLTVEIANETCIFARSTNEQTNIYVNGKKYTLTKFTQFLADKCFRIPNEFPFLSFRSLVPFFIRPDRNSYNECMIPAKAGTPYQNLLLNAFLIGLNVDLARKKHGIKKELENIQNWKKNIKNDSFLKDFLSDRKSAELTLLELVGKIRKLESDIATFEVAEDYDDIAKDGDALKLKLLENRNKITLLISQISNIDESLTIDPDINSDEIIKIYNEAKTVLQESVVKTLNDVKEFYRLLSEKRKSRLWSQKTRLLEAKKILEHEQKNIQENFDKCLKYLGEHRAIDVYRAAVQQREELIRERDKITQFEKITKELESKEIAYKKEMLTCIQWTQEYLSTNGKSIESLRDFFRTVAQKFYPDSTAGITVACNNGDYNQLCYDIEARLESDNSHGIGNVKILCYDLTLLFRGENHFVRFLFHDSCVLHGIDDIHINVWFSVLDEFFPNGGKYQYISTINQNQIELLKQKLSPTEFQRLIEDRIILTLTDEGDEGKLLGLTADISYL